MNRRKFLLAAGAAGAATLDDVKARGVLNCGVTTGLVGFAAPDANGEWNGFDVGVCRAVAAAVLGDPTAVHSHWAPRARSFGSPGAPESRSGGRDLPLRQIA